MINYLKKLGVNTMKKLKISKIFIFFIFLTLMSSTFVSGSNLIINSKEKNISYEITEPPLPGCMNTAELELDFKDYQTPILQLIKPEPTLYDQNIGLLIDSISEEQYLDYLEGLVSYGPRVTTTNACYDAGEYIYNQFLEMGIDARIQEWSDNNYYGTNIEGTIQGIDEDSDEIFIICAHYDSVPDSPGADDDGSGVAAVLTAASIMSQFSFNNTIKFVAFSGEEQGLYGSYYYVDEALQNNDNIVAVLNADMIGFAESEEDESYVHIYEDDNSAWLAEYAVDVSQEYADNVDLEVYRAGYSWGSDHYRFWQGGYNAIFYAEHNFNDYYHSSNDLIEHMNIPYAVKISKLMIATLAELSEMTGSNPPLKPAIPQGPSTGKPGEEYTYSAVATDPDGNDIYYQFDWGNGNFTDWLGPYASGTEIQTTHIWSEEGKYNIRVKAKDDGGLESQWSDPLVVSMPKGKYQDAPFISFLLKHSFLSKFIFLFHF